MFLLLGSGSVLAAGQEKFPSFDEVAKQALDYAELDPRAISRWKKNVRRAPLLPRLQAGFQRQLENNLDIQLEDNVSVTSSGVTVGPTGTDQNLTTNNDVNFEVKAVWYLDQLLFSQEDLDISQEARYLAQERRRVLEDVRRHYFGWRQAKAGLEKEERLAALDSLTGGWFSSSIAGEQR
ncbi:MAG: hypothetical protein Q7S68_03900 [Deltaproteobacteria bacterium]|nr:hypothetical protein [Deltaproteobacteria bacterium]